MEIDFQDMEDKEKIIKEAKRIEEDSLYSSKGHFYAAQFWSKFHLVVGVFISAIVATAGTFVLWKFEPYRIVVGSLTILVSALNAVLTFTNSSKRAATHVSAGNCYNDLRNRSRLFSEIEVNSEPYEKSLEKLRCLCIERNELNSRFPQIPKWAFNKARKGIEEGEARYKVDS